MRGRVHRLPNPKPADAGELARGQEVWAYVARSWRRVRILEVDREAFTIRCAWTFPTKGEIGIATVALSDVTRREMNSEMPGVRGHYSPKLEAADAARFFNHNRSKGY